MTFLNPTFLFALFASAIPILIHLFNLRRLRTVEFSSVKFLKELQRSRIRALKIKQIILLIIRVLAIVFLVLAFSRPVIKGYFFNPIVAGQAKSSVVIILDNTLSMASVDERGKFINQAKAIAQRIADLLTESDEFALIRLSEIPEVATNGFIHNVSFLRKLIDETEFTYTHKNLADAFATAGEIIEKAKNLNREIYLISDFQKGEFILADTLNRKIKLPFDVRVFMINVGEFMGQNFSVDEVDIKNKIIFPGRILELEATVSNHSQNDVSNYVVSVFLNGRRVAQKGINLKRQSSQAVNFNVLTEDLSGFVDGFVEIEDDNFNFDNRRYFTLFIPSELKILLVGDDDDLKFIKLAFSTVQETYKKSLFKLTQVSPQAISRVNFSEFDVIFFVKPSQIEIETSKRLKSFVSGGGALILFVGGNVNIQNLNQNFNSIFELPEFDGVVRQRMLFSKIDFNHPIFEGVFAEAPRKFDSPEIKEYVKFRASYGFTTIIELSDGNPFLIEKNWGDGKILVFTSGPTDKTTDLPYKGIFIPLVFQSVLYTAVPSSFKAEYTIGDTAEVRIDFMRRFYGRTPKDLKLKRPDGSDFAFKLSDNFVKISQATVPGIYLVSDGDARNFLKIAFNPPSVEFSYEKEDEGKVSAFLNWVGAKHYKVISRLDELKVRDEILRARYGVELWKTFLVLSILMFFAESLISRKM